MKKILFRFLILLITVVLLGIQNVYADTVITKESLENSLKQYICDGKKVSATIDNMTLTVGGNTIPEEQVQITETSIIIVVKTEQTGLENDLNIVFNYEIQDNQIKFIFVSQDSSTEETMLATTMLPMIYLSVTDIYGIDSQKALEYFVREGNNNSTDTAIETEVYSAYMAEKEMGITIYLDKISVIENNSSSNYNQNNNDYNNSNTNIGNNNNSNDNSNKEKTTNRGDVDRKDNTKADGKLPYTGKHMGLTVITIVSIMLIVGIVNKRKYKDIK